MKHKLLFGFIAAAMAAVMCVGFAACGGVNAKGVKGERVDAETWTKAFENLTKKDAVFTIEVSSVTRESEKGKDGELVVDNSSENSTSYTIIKNGSKEYVHSVVERTTSESGEDASGESSLKSERKTDTESYAEYTGSKYVVYRTNESGRWATFDGISGVIPFSAVLGLINGTYSAYSYSEDEQGYVLSDPGEYDYPYVVKFDKDGRLVAIYCEYSREEEENGIKTVKEIEFNLVITYEADEITLPTVG